MAKLYSSGATFPVIPGAIQTSILSRLTSKAFCLLCRNGIYSGDDQGSSYDHNSLYSYNTAVDERDSGVSGESVVSYMDYNPLRHYNRTLQARANGFGDSVSVQSSQTGALFADLVSDVGVHTLSSKPTVYHEVRQCVYSLSWLCRATNEAVERLN